MNAVSMKPKHIDIDAGIIEKHTIRAALSPKIANTIYTGMVADKAAYPVREIGKNAHEVSPKDKPWRLKLPTVYDSRAVFRDYGPGLSHHFMMYRYPKIGDSTRDKNGVNGMSGLGYGSKSPFSLLIEEGKAGSYNVASYQKGEARFYLISLTEKGDIQVKLLHRCETTEHDGLEVSFDVAEDIREQFCASAAEVLWSFEPRPLVSPAPAWPTPTVIASGDGWVRYQPRTVPWSGPHVRVNKCVMYPLDLSLVDDGAAILQSSYCIIFEVDQDGVDATSSREALQYTAKTKKTLSDALQNYASQVVQNTQKEIDGAKNWFDAWAKLWDIASNHDDHWKKLLSSRITWKDRKLSSFVLDADGFKVDFFHHYHSVFTGFTNHKSIVASNVSGAKIAIQYGADRTGERLSQLGLLGTKFILFRMTKKDRKAFLLRFGLSEGDYFDLNAIKLPPVQNVVFVPKPASTTLLLPVFEVGSRTTGLEDVDISTHRYYVLGQKEKIYKKRAYWAIELSSCQGFRELDGGTMRHFINAVFHADISYDSKIVVWDVEKKDMVPEGWTEWSADVIAKAVSFYDPSQLTRSYVSWNRLDRRWRSFIAPETNSELVDVAFPEDLVCLREEGRKLKDGSTGLQQNKHDHIHEFLVFASLEKPIDLTDEVHEFEKRLKEHIKNRYPLLEMLLPHDGYGSTRIEDRTHKIRYYFKLIELAHPLIN